jgi:hypothetical protein
VLKREETIREKVLNFVTVVPDFISLHFSKMVNYITAKLRKHKNKLKKKRVVTIEAKKEVLKEAPTTPKA